MNCFLIDPKARTVTRHDLEGQSFLDEVGQAIGARQLDTMMLGQNIVMWFDSLGLLKPGQSYWRFTDSTVRISGACLVTAVTEEGIPAAVPDSVDPQTIADGIDWCEGEELVRIEETVVPIESELGPWPRIVRNPVWKQTVLPPSASSPDGLMWIVYANTDGSYRAVQFENAPGAQPRPVQLFRAEDLEAIRSQLPQGLTRREPEPNDDPAIEEIWF